MSTPFAGSLLNFAHPFSDQLVARWIFNQGSGTTSKDLVSHSVLATTEHSAAIGTKPGSGLTLFFDDTVTDTRARAPNETQYQTLAAAPFSVSVLFYLRVPIPFTFGLISKMNAATGKTGWYVDVGNTGQIIFDVGGATNNMQLVSNFSSADRVTQDILFHALCVWTGQSALGNHIYLQGVTPPNYSVFGSPNNGSGAINSDAGTELAIGSGWGGTNGNFPDVRDAAADIIDVNIWAKAIDATLAAQIAADPFANIFRNFSFSYSF
jgi:hypothetical protein